MDDKLYVLTECYSEPHRHYHTLEHIAYMFNVAKYHGVQLTHAQKQAIWWHDAVCTPGSKLNEGDSIALMMKYEDTGWQSVEAIDMIWDTATHKPKTDQSAIVSDLDMFIFADSFSIHHRYTQQLRREFVDLPLQEYREGRIGFLENLKAEPIYYSKTFRAYRPKAVHAIEKEIKELRLLMSVEQ